MQGEKKADRGERREEEKRKEKKGKGKSEKDSFWVLFRFSKPDFILPSIFSNEILFLLILNCIFDI